MHRHDVPDTIDAAARARADSADSARFSLATGEEPISRVRTDLPDLEAVLDRYEPGPTLGEGGMGIVTLRRDRAIGRYVAQKMLHADLADATTARRFVREARAQAQLEHPAIVPVYDIGRDPERGPFFTMKRVRGHTLARVLEGLVENEPEYTSRYTRRRLITAFLQVCRAVHYAHARRVLHRDLKPSNVMLGDYGEVYVLDWGLARILDEAPLEPETRDAGAAPRRPEVSNARIDLSRATVDDGSMAGTPGYMAPEQLNGDALDARTDVYSLGVVLYEILTLRRYREITTLAAAAMDVHDGRVARPSDVDPAVDPELDGICVRATAIDPNGRIQSAGALADAIERVLDGEHDAELRTAAAARHVQRAKEALASKERDGREARRVRAMHELLRAATLDPSADEARSLLVELLSGASEIPEGARGDIRAARDVHRNEGLSAAIVGICAWLLPTPIVLAVVPVLSWPATGATLLACLVVVAIALGARARGRFDTSIAITLATLTSLIILGISGILGPFVLTPVCAVAVSMFFAMYVSRRERAIVTVLFTIVGLLPFVLEALGLVPPSYAIANDQIVLYARTLSLPPVATILALAWACGSFTVISAWMTGRMHDRLERAEERLLVSAWHLRQLFSPETTAEPVASAAVHSPP